MDVIDDLAYSCTQVLRTYTLVMYNTEPGTHTQCYRNLIKGHLHGFGCILLIANVFLKVHFV